MKNKNGGEESLKLIDFRVGAINLNLLKDYTKAIIFCFSITDRQSFKFVDVALKNPINQEVFNLVPCILIGNKCDLQEERKVSEEEA